MAKKRSKPRDRQFAHQVRRDNPASGHDSSPAPPVAHPPAKQPVLLAICLGLFALWLIFLLLTAIRAA